MAVNNFCHEMGKGLLWGAAFGFLALIVVESILLVKGYDAMAAIIAIGCFIGSMAAGSCIGPIAAPLVASVREYLDKQQTINAEEIHDKL
jgi:hypothetical protein